MKKKFYNAPETVQIKCADLSGQFLAASCFNETPPESIDWDLNSSTESGGDVDFNAKSHHFSLWDEEGTIP